MTLPSGVTPDAAPSRASRTRVAVFRVMPGPASRMAATFLLRVDFSAMGNVGWPRVKLRQLRAQSINACGVFLDSPHDDDSAEAVR